MRSITWLITLSWTVLLLAGCKGNEGKKNNRQSPLPGTIGEMDIPPIDETGYQALIEKRNGKILLVNFWATWCAPCREEFPDLVKVANQYATRGVEVVGISADMEEDVEDKVKPFLRKNKAGFSNFLKVVEDDGTFIDFVHRDWSGALPATFVYDGSGRLHTWNVGKAGYDDFRKMLDEVLDKQAQ
ncbi:MAG: TlpA family protein disulfide reductase [Calditrichia bacterium]